MSLVFSETLQSITTTKLNELSKKRKAFEDQKTFHLSIAGKESNHLERVRLLADGVKKCFSVRNVTRRTDGRNSPIRIVDGVPHLEVLLKNLEFFLEQAKYDPSISTTLLSDWEKSLVKTLKVRSLKYEYATLYGKLVTEWLDAEKSSDIPDDMSMLSEDFEKVERTAKEESRAEWEKTVFEPFETDQIAISEFLRNLFGEDGNKKLALTALNALRRSVATFETSLRAPGQFNDGVLRWTINGLLASGLMSDEKRGVLKEFLASPVILSEIADVLNMRLASISTWDWEQEVPIEQRRHVTGAYHIYIDEELLQAIFLQYIGIKFSVFFKEAFVKFADSGAWTSLRQSVATDARKRREYFLGPQQKKPSVQSKRQGIYKSIFFMSQLPDSPQGLQGSSSAPGEEEAIYDLGSKRRQVSQFAQASANAQRQMQIQAMAQMQQQQQRQQSMVQSYAMAQQAPPPPQANSIAAPNPNWNYQNYNNEEYDLENDKPANVKQFLLHLLSAEVLMNTRLHGDFTCARSQFYSFSPTLPHSTILSVLSFFGLSDKWISFFHKFLGAPLKFVEDGDDSPTRKRKRGVPGAHALSAVCGEVILFCLDYSVNQQTHGAQLYRMHDDFWIWSSSHATAVSAWSAITRFSDVMGVTLNPSKTGTVRIRYDKSADATIDDSLPKGDIRWGFLYLDPATGRFKIDQEMVDKHVLELQRQLESKNKSIFSWVQAWNTYAGTFFSTNFGKPANSFGREHVTDILTTMNRVQKQLFKDTKVAAYLKATLKKRFDIDDIPDGFLYFPAALGGLELQNPFIPLLQVKSSVLSQPSSLLDRFLDSEKEAYRKAKERFEKGQVYRQTTSDPSYYPADYQTFISFEEFTSHREEFYSGYSGDLLSCFTEFLKYPEAETVDSENVDWDALRDAMAPANGEVDDYLKWVAQLYGKDMREKFGGLQIVEKGLLPMGMVGLFRSGRVKWQG
ncbi:uncharacterized protein LY89DRAFT_629916 [Mollisia scopiformis]|uniref:Reverse transcriptase domain-containing protein n=1 Tax=Mollisia scopiformis TaxID=149040 RepID=A0A132B832_MOLSC|nr:uncharacterized protein LY89DRAFT_629916 [Mollisia scopiformis]KUJ08149.1 hypothetical protein LY89DRAFT_629916 [Mollisia scopiformis]